MAMTRRTVLERSLAATAMMLLPTTGGHAQQGSTPTRVIPSSGETIPAVGLGTWIIFNVGEDPVLRDGCVKLMAAFFEGGGAMIDCSPMYGSSQPVVGHGVEKLGRKEDMFATDKVWTSSAGEDRAVAAPLGRAAIRADAGA